MSNPSVAKLAESLEAGEPNQFGRVIMVYEDGAGLISHYYLMGRQEMDADVVVEQTKIAQDRLEMHSLRKNIVHYMAMHIR